MKRRDFLTRSTAGTLGLALTPQLVGAKAPFQTLTGPHPYRQVHLDFHTSEFIENVAEKFDPDEFADTMVKAHVKAVNVFGRCHHGMIYYDTKKFPERKHPHLKRNLLAEQIEALHKRGIRAPIYVTLQADYFTAKHHPEWRMIEPDGSPKGGPIDTADFWKLLCLNSPFTGFLKEHVSELFDIVPVDGLWLDIIAPRDCSCASCKAGMEKSGLDPRKAKDRGEHAVTSLLHFMEDFSTHIRSHSKDCSIYYNSGHIWPYHRRASKAFTHFELESLSTTKKWAYPYFMTVSRYARTLGKEMIGMTGKFQTEWGDFHSFKSQAGLEFDCFQCLAANAKCCVGDQLHPSGKIDPVTYNLIGSVYSQIERKEPWCEGAQAVVDIAVFNSEEYLTVKEDPVPPVPLTGAVRMLLEGKRQFDIVDSQSDLSGYKLLVLPDQYPVNQALAAKLSAYAAAGGSIIATHEGILDPASGGLAMEDLFGVRKTGPGPVAPDGKPAAGRSMMRNEFVQYVVPAGPIGIGLPEAEHVMYNRGLDIEALPGSEILLPNVVSYFDRVHPRFCSHRQTPSSGKTGLPAVVRKGKAIYFSHPLFTMYCEKAPIWCKRLFLNAVNLLIGEGPLVTSAPSNALVMLNEQKSKKRKVLHVLHYVHERRADDFDVIEDVVPLHDIEVSIEATAGVSAVNLVPEMQPLKFSIKEGRATFTIPKVTGHQMVEIQQS